MTGISALCPSRGRTAILRDSAASLLDLADDPGRVEVLVAADPDDEPTLSAVLPPGARMWIAPRRFGYARHYEYYNALAAMACGEWLMVWNDDGVMLTPGWDSVILAEEPGVLWPRADYAPASNTFPVWPAAWTRLTGHVSLAWCCDTWMQEVGRMLGVQRPVPVTIRHDRYEDATAAEGRHTVNVADFWAEPMARLREADVAKIRELL